jgi:hypothetical protein
MPLLKLSKPVVGTELIAEVREVAAQARILVEAIG